ncbi:MAG: BlaI/MecI/CopY family transcriptional regulator [Mycobacteriales bacterium]
MRGVTRLGDLERAVMQTLWTAPTALTGREVAAALARPELAYTTVLTVLTRLEKKDLVRRDSSAKAHTYSPVASREDHVTVLMQQALGQAGDRAAALQHFARSMTTEEAATLRAALEEKPSQALDEG